MLNAFTGSLENLEKQEIAPIRDQKRESGLQNNEDNKENGKLVPLDKKKLQKKKRRRTGKQGKEPKKHWVLTTL